MRHAVWLTGFLAATGHVLAGAQTQTGGDEPGAAVPTAGTDELVSQLADLVRFHKTKRPFDVWEPRGGDEPDPGHQAGRYRTDPVSVDWAQMRKTKTLRGDSNSWNPQRKYFGPPELPSPTSSLTTATPTGPAFLATITASGSGSGSSSATPTASTAATSALHRLYEREAQGSEPVSVDWAQMRKTKTLRGDSDSWNPQRKYFGPPELPTSTSSSSSSTATATGSASSATPTASTSAISAPLPLSKRDAQGSDDVAATVTPAPMVTPAILVSVVSTTYDLPAAATPTPIRRPVKCTSKKCQRRATTQAFLWEKRRKNLWQVMDFDICRRVKCFWRNRPMKIPTEESEEKEDQLRKGGVFRRGEEGEGDDTRPPFMCGKRLRFHEKLRKEVIEDTRDPSRCRAKKCSPGAPKKGRFRGDLDKEMSYDPWKCRYCEGIREKHATATTTPTPTPLPEHDWDPTTVGTPNGPVKPEPTPTPPPPKRKGKKPMPKKPVSLKQGKKLHNWKPTVTATAWVTLTATAVPTGASVLKRDVAGVATAAAAAAATPAVATSALEVARTTSDRSRYIRCRPKKCRDLYRGPSRRCAKRPVGPKKPVVPREPAGPKKLAMPRRPKTTTTASADPDYTPTYVLNPHPKGYPAIPAEGFADRNNWDWEGRPGLTLVKKSLPTEPAAVGARHERREIPPPIPTYQDARWERIAEHHPTLLVPVEDSDFRPEDGDSGPEDGEALREHRVITPAHARLPIPTYQDARWERFAKHHPTLIVPVEDGDSGPEDGETLQSAMEPPAKAEPPFKGVPGVDYPLPTDPETRVPFGPETEWEPTLKTRPPPPKAVQGRGLNPPAVPRKGPLLPVPIPLERINRLLEQILPAAPIKGKNSGSPSKAVAKGPEDGKDQQPSTTTHAPNSGIPTLDPYTHPCFRGSPWKRPVPDRVKCHEEAKLIEAKLREKAAAKGPGDGKGQRPAATTPASNPGTPGVDPRFSDPLFRGSPSSRPIPHPHDVQENGELREKKPVVVVEARQTPQLLPLKWPIPPTTRSDPKWERIEKHRTPPPEPVEGWDSGEPAKRDLSDIPPPTPDV
ncbi:hypothetical protein LZ31DRAFT_594176 [Colletotrichum somersetense]|nr:hypothetical protein LZ31DRAFT_594176 [Colletotrichum somersetense]